MLPCFICGRNAETGWIKGFPPAPDSQKLALCPQHDTQANRRKVEEAWRNFLSSAIGEHTRNSLLKSHGAPRTLRIIFVGGGNISVPCLDFQTRDQNTLKVFTPAGETLFFPLRQVKHYVLSAPESALNAQPAPQEPERTQVPAGQVSPTAENPPNAEAAERPETRPHPLRMESALKKLPAGALNPNAPVGQADDPEASSGSQI